MHIAVDFADNRIGNEFMNERQFLRY